MRALDRDIYGLSTGKKFYANNLVIGISQNYIGDKEISISEGHDGSVFRTDEYGFSEFTKQEVIEIADFMITQWNNLKQNVIDCDGWNK